MGSGAELYFKGTNHFAANITSESTVTCSENAVLDFINYDTLSVDAAFTGLSGVMFNGSATVSFTRAKPLDVGNLAIKVGNGFAAGDTKVGNDVIIASGVKGLSDDKVVEFDGVETTIGASPLSYSDSTFTLSAEVAFAQCAKNEKRENISFIDADYSEDFGTVSAGCDKNVVGRGVSATALKGILHAAEKKVAMSDLSYDGRIYGGAEHAESAAFGGADVALEDVKIASGSRIYGGADIVVGGAVVTGKEANISLSVGATSDSEIAQVYGGARMAGPGCTFVCGAICTTIDGGTYTGFVGNGSQAAGGVVTAASTSLTINGGSFESYVYAGMYSQSSDVVATVHGDATLQIAGGTFNGKVFGGSAASRNAYARTTTIEGSVNVTVDASGDNKIAFNSHLFAGSQANGKVDKGATVTFTGKGANLTFGIDSYVSGGSETDADYSNVNMVKDSLKGDRNLVFRDFSGDFGANLKNLFDSVSFTGSSVTFTGAKELDLRLVDTWSFDLSDGAVDLTWTRGMNDFSGDAMKLAGFAGEEKTVMAGSADTLKGWDSLGSLWLGGTELTKVGPSEDRGYVKYTADGKEYKLGVDASGNLKFGYLA
ncbi:MAG: hypothetical protein MJ202_10735 [Lentisphaeria bacterium]|nr:hypothetical protein [Lentisphaeria bacterium]MCQ2404183.1 hypothetical protein [Lentisphaeria bacterium]